MSAATQILDVPGLSALEAPESVTGGSLLLPWKEIGGIAAGHAIAAVIRDWGYFKSGVATTARLWRTPLL